jgi:hypothetical protein
LSFSQELKNYFLENKNVVIPWKKDRGFTKGVETMHKVADDLKMKKKINKRGKSKRKNNNRCSSKNYNWSYFEGIAYRNECSYLGDIYYKNGKKERSNIPREIYVDSINSIRLKKHPIRNSTRLQKFSKAPFNCSVFFNEYREYFEKYDVDVDRSITAHGC